MKLTKYALSMIALSLIAAAAMAFVNQPPFEPQRHILFDFDLAPQYLGPNDHLLWDSDWIQITLLTVHLYPEIDIFPGRSGMLGIDNRMGMNPVSGWIRLHLDNWDWPNVEKLIWDEVEWIVWGEADYTLEAPGGHQVDLITLPAEQFPDGFFLDNHYATIMPNPPYEEFVWSFTVQPGAVLLFDRWEIATVCVPEPSCALGLSYGIGALGIVLFRRRRRQ